jgi:predicted DCC family thiol-disulfide oxidoreductase YuxK
MAGQARAAGESARGEWIVLYDGECGFCKWALARLLRWDRDARLRPLALQHPRAAQLLADIPYEERMASWHLVSPAGARTSGGAALAPALRLFPCGALPAAALERFPALTERAYRWVADHRTSLSAWVPSASKRRAGERVRARERALATDAP